MSITDPSHQDWLEAFENAAVALIVNAKARQLGMGEDDTDFWSYFDEKEDE